MERHVIKLEVSTLAHDLADAEFLARLLERELKARTGDGQTTVRIAGIEPHYTCTCPPKSHYCQAEWCKRDGVCECD